jgi:hypothetical protein
MYGHDQARTNCNLSETAIGSSNVTKLIPLWTVDVGTNGSPSSSAPIVSQGVVYVGSSVGSGPNYFAITASSGSPLWGQDVGHPDPVLGPFPCGNVGVGSTGAVGAGILAVGGGDSAYYALDPSSGNIVWRLPLNAGSSAFPWESPLIANSLVYLGIASGCDNPVVPGQILAVDPSSGTVVQDEFLATAAAPGAGIWNSPSLTPDGLSLFIATGEDNGTNGTTNPYAQSIVGLNSTSLAVVESNKQGPIGQDADYGTTPIIFSDETGRVLVGAAQKTGVFYAYLKGQVDKGPIWSRSVGLVIGLASAYDATAGSGGTLFFGGAQGFEIGVKIYAVDPATGQDRLTPIPVAGQIYGNLAIANGLLYVNEGVDGVFVYDDKTGAQITALVPPSPGPVYTGVTVSNGVVYFMSGSVLNAWGLPN